MAAAEDDHREHATAVEGGGDLGHADVVGSQPDRGRARPWFVVEPVVVPDEPGVLKVLVLQHAHSRGPRLGDRVDDRWLAAAWQVTPSSASHGWVLVVASW